MYDDAQVANIGSVEGYVECPFMHSNCHSLTELMIDDAQPWALESWPGLDTISKV
jgi:hypothetical protein